MEDGIFSSSSPSSSSLSSLSGGSSPSKSGALNSLSQLDPLTGCLGCVVVIVLPLDLEEGFPTLVLVPVVGFDGDDCCFGTLDEEILDRKVFVLDPGCAMSVSDDGESGCSLRRCDPLLPELLSLSVSVLVGD